MKLGVQMVFQSHGYDDSVTDAQVIDEEIQLAVLAEQLGFDALWPVEHHFEDYSFCPDNFVVLAHLAARTTSISLGTGAVILPWNDPLRVAEKASLLDHLSGGRLLLGFGRGLARREYEGMGIDMDTSRDRFDEAAAMVVEALRTGTMHGDGRYYARPETPIRPRPNSSFDDRIFSVAMSPDSVLSAADLGAQMIVFSQKPWEDQAESYAIYCDRYLTAHDASPKPLLTCDFAYCDVDPGRAQAKAHEHIAGYLTSVMHHYELAGDHFKDAKGYESYGNAVDLMKAIGLEKMCDMYLDVQAWGTPDQMIERLMARREHVGDYDLTCCFRFSGLSLADSERSMRTVAEHVMPTLRAEFN